MHYAPWLRYTSDRHSGYGRISIEEGRTAFEEGREFRIFKELNLAPSAIYVMKLVLPIDIVIYSATVEIESGQLRLSVVSGGTEGGSFSETFTRFPANGMTPGRKRRNDYNGTTYQPTVVITAGGTLTGGTETEVVRVKANNNTNAGSTVTPSSTDARGVAPGTYYFRFQNLSGVDTLSGVFRLRWEERPDSEPLAPPL